MKIPRRQSDIKLKTFLEYQEWYKNIPEDKMEDSKYIIENTIKIFYGIDDEKIQTLPYTEILNMFHIIENIMSIEQQIKPIFTIKGKEYGFLPNFNDMTLGEFIDCNNDDVLKQMCILYRPITKRKGKKYIIEPYKADISIYDELKENLTLDVYNGFIGFFLRIQQTLLSCTLNSLMEMDLTPKMKKDLAESGVGSPGFMNSVMETLQNKT